MSASYAHLGVYSDWAAMAADPGRGLPGRTGTWSAAWSARSWLSPANASTPAACGWSGAGAPRDSTERKSPTPLATARAPGPGSSSPPGPPARCPACSRCTATTASSTTGRKRSPTAPNRPRRSSPPCGPTTTRAGPTPTTWPGRASWCSCPTCSAGGAGASPWPRCPPLIQRLAELSTGTAPPDNQAPSPLLVQYNRDDELFTLAGAQAANERITAHYADTSAPDAYTGQFYDGHHKFDQAMQRDAFAWLTTQLG